MSRAGQPARVAVIGAGTVGSAVLRALAGREGVVVTGVLVRDPGAPRDFPGHSALVTADPDFLPEADIVVEVAGGTGGAADLALAALARGQTVVSANKAALAERWDEFAPALASGRLHFEAAVMGGVPVVGALAAGLRGAGARELHAVLNGTCNVILSAMEGGKPYSEALGDAQAAGFAEADPSLDVEGVDTAHKLALLLRLAFDPRATWERVARDVRGITDLDPQALLAARRAGRSVRLVGSVGWRAGEGWRTAVRPVALAHDHPLVAQGPINAMSFRGSEVSEVLLRGPGAGGAATASAVVSDLLTAAAGRPGPAPLPAPAPQPKDGAAHLGERDYGALEFEELS